MDHIINLYSVFKCKSLKILSDDWTRQKQLGRKITGADNDLVNYFEPRCKAFPALLPCFKENLDV